MKVKFSRCTSSNLANVPQVDGQLIYIKDLDRIYMDVGNDRKLVSELITVANIQNVSTPVKTKVYYDEATDKLYKSINANWIPVSGVKSNEVLTLDNLTEFTPTNNYQPATKQYVDIQVGNINTILDSINGEVV